MSELFIQLRSSVKGRANRPGLHVGDAGAQAAPGAPGRDVAAHRARTDDMDMGDRLIARPSQCLELLAQEKGTDEILRAIAHHEMCEGSDLRPFHRLLVATMSFPQVDERMGRGIMGQGCLGFRLAAHLPRCQMADWRGVLQAIQQCLTALVHISCNRCHDGGVDMAFRNYRIDQPHVFRVASIDRLAGQHQFHRRDRIA